MVSTIKFSEMPNAGNVNNNDVSPSLRSSTNVLLTSPWVFLPPGTTAQRPAPSSIINYRLRFNTDDNIYEYYNPALGEWIQLEQSSFTPGPFITYTEDTSLPDAQNLALLSNGILKQSIAFGNATLDIAVQGTDYYAPGDTPTFAGMTMTGNIDMNGFRAINADNPVDAQDYATKLYVDQTALNGTSVYAASAGSLGTVTQSGAGVGATLTNAGVQAALQLDGVLIPVGVNVLIKNTATGMTDANEGIYTVTDPGSASSNWVLTRATSYDTAEEINMTGLILIQNGSTLMGTAWYNAATIVTVDTDPFSYSQFGNIIFPINVPQGGTGFTSTTAYGLLAGGTTSTGNLQNIGTGSPNTVLMGNGASSLPFFSTATYPSTTTINQILYSNANNAITGLTTANSSVLTTSAGGVPGFTALTAFLQSANNLSDLQSAAAALINLGAVGSINVQTFTGSGTYTPSAHLIGSLVFARGSGAAGGGTPTASGVTFACGAGGGGGEAAWGYFDAATIGANQTVTIGAGGVGVANATGGSGNTTSFGSLLTALGGVGGGAGTAASTAGINSTGGAGGSGGTGGFMRFPGSPGHHGFQFPSNGAFSGAGGECGDGAGGAIGINQGAGSSSVGNAAVANSGAGGGGSAINSITGTTLAGGNGGSGYMAIIEFIS